MSDRTTRRRVAYGVVVIQWLLLTLALGVMIIYTDRSLDGLIGFHIDSGYAFLGASVIGFLMGATVERTRVLILMVVTCCIGGAGIYVALIFYPVWTGKLVHTVGLENFASTRAFLYFGLSIVPVSLGAMAGRLAGSIVPGGDLLRGKSTGGDHDWWLSRPTRKSTTGNSVEKREPGELTQ